MTTGAGQTRTLWVSRHPLFREAAHCWPSASLLVGSHRHLSSSHTWHCGGHREPGLVRASVDLSRVLTEAGVSPAVHLRGPAPLAASPTQPVSEFVLSELAVSSWAWGADTHARKLTHSGH